MECVAANINSFRSRRPSRLFFEDYTGQHERKEICAKPVRNNKATC